MYLFICFLEKSENIWGHSLLDASCFKFVNKVNLCQIYEALHLKQAESDNTDKDEPAEEEGKTDDVQLFADEGFDAEFRVSTWEQTILGKLSF